MHAHISRWSAIGYHITDTNNLREGLYAFSVGRSDVSKSCNSRGGGKVYTASKQVSIIVITTRSLVCIVCGEFVIDWCIKHTHRTSSTKLTAVAWPPPTFDSPAEGRIVFVVLKRKHLRCLFTARLCMTTYLYYIVVECTRVVLRSPAVMYFNTWNHQLRQNYARSTVLSWKLDSVLDTKNHHWKCRHRVDEKYNY